MTLVPEASKSVARCLWRLLVVSILVQLGKRVQVAGKVVFWVVGGVVYMTLLVLPELCGLELDALASMAYYLTYGLLHTAYSVFGLSLRLADTARRVRNIRIVEGYFEY
jgi:hypothetical protein